MATAVSMARRALPHVGGVCRYPRGAALVAQCNHLQTIAARSSSAKGNDHGAREAVEKIEGILAAGETRTLSTMIVSDLPAPHVGNVRVLRLRREKAKNAISRQLLAELGEQIQEVLAEQRLNETRALIITSELDDVFCAGADLKERRDMSQQETQDFLTSLRRAFSGLASLPVPSIAAISGAALGGGLELALACHLRVFSSNAIVGLPETRLGIIPGAGGTYRLPQVVGLSHARDLILTGRRVHAGEAAAIGLCNRLVAASADEAALDPMTKRTLTLGAAVALAQEVANGGPIAVRAAVSALAGVTEEAENAAYDSLLHTKDRVEALQAFREKRAPSFSGE